MAIDPICGMTVDEATARSAERDGQTVYFCSEHCRQKFLAGGKKAGPAQSSHDHHEPAPQKQQGSGKYVCPMCKGVESDKPGNCPKCGMALEPARPAAQKQKVIYTCPMHPEIEQDGPGTCPKCGMALEPKTVQPDKEEDDSELRSMTRRFWVAARLDRAGAVAGDVADARRSCGPLAGNHAAFLAATPAQYAGGSVGRLAVLRAWLEVHRHLEPQYVHAHRHRHGGGLPLQPRRRAVPRPHSRKLSGITERCRSISRRRR